MSRWNHIERLAVVRNDRKIQRCITSRTETKIRNLEAHCKQHTPSRKKTPGKWTHIRKNKLPNTTIWRNANQISQ